MESNRVYVHPTAMVHPSAVLREGAWIGPLVFIDEGVVVGHYAVVGGGPEHRDFHDDVSIERSKGVQIGRGVRIFDFVTINAGTSGPTWIFEDVAIHNHSHVAHDCVLEAGVTVAGHCALAGHVHAMRRSTIGARAVIHQRTVIGSLAMIGMGSVVKKDVPPGEMYLGFPAMPAGLNEVGLARAGLAIEQLREADGPRFEKIKGDRK